jgi:hypothetical protein
VPVDEVQEELIRQGASLGPSPREAAERRPSA